MSKKILLATDGSEASQRAGEYAVSTVKLSGADIIVLNVIDTDYLNSLPQRDLREKLDEELREEGKKALEGFEKKIEDEKCAGKCENINFRTLIKQGKPADVISKTAEEEGVDKVIIGKSGKHGLEKLLLGSTAERVVRKAEVSVSVVP